MDEKPPFLAKLGAAVRQHRTDANLSQEELAHLCGLHRTYIGGIERGERNVSIENILRIANALGTSCAALVGQIESSDLDFFSTFGTTLLTSFKPRSMNVGA